MVSPEKIAVCLSCGNEWEVKKADVKKRKCPLCGKYRVKMKNEITEPPGSVAPNSDQEGRKVEKSGEKEENIERREEKETEGSSSGLIFVALVCAAAGIGWFLWRQCRAKRDQIESYGDYEYEENLKGAYCNEYAGF